MEKTPLARPRVVSVALPLLTTNKHGLPSKSHVSGVRISSSVMVPICGSQMIMEILELPVQLASPRVKHLTVNSSGVSFVPRCKQKNI